MSDARIEAAIAQLDELATQLMARTGVPGMAVAVVRADRTVYARGFGVRQLGAPQRVDADTVFQLASVSKSIGATVVAHQVGLGKLAWDTPLHRLLPWFALRDPAATARVTVADLYSHRSGLPDHAGDFLEDLGYGRRQVLERLRFEPLAPLGSRYAYTNFGLTAAAEGVATAAATDWATLSQQTLYRPLGMDSTSSRFADFAARPNRALGHVKAHGQWTLGVQREPDAQSPAGGVSSSVNDMAKWMSMLLGRGVFTGRQVVDAAALQAAVSPQIQSAPAQDGRPAAYYGYGFVVGTTGAGRANYGHSGAFSLGAATTFKVIPSLGLAIVALTNGVPLGIPETLCQQFVDLVEFGRPQQDWGALYSAALAAMLAPSGSLVGVPRPNQPQAPSPLASYVGSYRNDYYGALHVAQRQGALTLTLGPAARSFVLTHWDGQVFIFQPEGEIAEPGSISKATFDGLKLTLEIYDAEGLGTFVRG